jgi:WD40 repeat protein
VRTTLSLVAFLLMGVTAPPGRVAAAEGRPPSRPTEARSVPPRAAVFYLPPDTKRVDKDARELHRNGSWLVRKGVFLDLANCTGICFLESGATLEDAAEVEILVAKKGATLSDTVHVPAYIYCEKGTHLPRGLPRKTRVEQFDSIAFAPWRPFTLTGRVRDAGGKGRAGIKVHAYGLADQHLAQTTTDGGGAFTFRPREQVKYLAVDCGELWYKHPSFHKELGLEFRQRLRGLRGGEVDIQTGLWGRDASLVITTPAPAPVAIPSPTVLLAHELSVRKLVFSRNGDFLSTISGVGWPCLWGVSSGEEIQRFAPHHLSAEEELYRARHYPADPRSVAIEPRGRSVACFGPSGSLGLWDAQDGKRLHQLKGHKGAVRCAVFTPDGRTLASGGADGAIRLWDVKTGKARGVIKAHPGRVDALACSPNGKTLISTGLLKDGGHDDYSTQDVMRAWDAATGKPVWAFDRTCADPVFSPDGERVAAEAAPREVETARTWREPIAYQPLLICDSATGRRLTQIAGHPAHTLAFTPDGLLLLTATAQGIRMWETATGQEVLACPLPERDVAPVAFSPDARTLAVGRKGGTVALYTIRPHRLYVPEDRPYREAEWDRLWDNLASARAAAAYRALWALRREPGRATALLRRRLTPARALPLDRWVADLDSADFRTREAASKSLVAGGEGTARALRQVLKARPSLEVRRRIEHILAEKERRGPSPEELRSLRAVQLLEDLGSPAAREVLVTLSRGWPVAWQTRAARASLKRLH